MTLDFHNKEVWLVQLPKNTNLDEVELSESQATIGKATFKFRQAGLAPQKCRVFKHSDQHSKLKSLADVTIDRAITLATTVSLPTVPKSVVKPKPLVKQITGLRTRHFATGYDYDAKLEVSEGLLKPVEQKDSDETHKVNNDKTTPKNAIEHSDKSHKKMHKKDKKDKKRKLKD